VGSENFFFVDLLTCSDDCAHEREGAKALLHVFKRWGERTRGVHRTCVEVRWEMKGGMVLPPSQAPRCWAGGNLLLFAVCAWLERHSIPREFDPERLHLFADWSGSLARIVRGI
jgi:hypothetical protein